METNGQEIDRVLTALGPLGVFAWLQICVFYLTYLSDAFQIYSFVFITADVAHSCAAPSNESELVKPEPELWEGWLNSTSVRYDGCSIVVNRSASGNVSIADYPCVYGMAYAAPKESSIASDFDLVCGRQALVGLTQTLLTLGTGVSSFVSPWLSDLYGRKRILVLTLALTIAASLTAGFAPSYAVLGVAKFFVGFASAGNALVSITAVVELMTSQNRVMISGVVSNLWWVACTGSLTPIAYLLRFESWRTLQLAITAPAALSVLLTAFCAREPIRWLAANGKYTEAERVLKQAARLNRKDFPTILNIFRNLNPAGDKQVPQSASSAPLTGPVVQPPSGDAAGDGETNSEDLLPKKTESACTDSATRAGHGDLVLKDTAENKLGYLDILRHPLLRKQCISICVIWFLNRLVYDALYYMSGTLAVSLYWGFFLNAIVEGASALLMFALRRRGRKLMIVLFYGIGGLCLVTSSVCLYFQDNSSLRTVATVASLFGKLGISGALNVLLFYTPEIFPTNIRNRALGVTMLASTLGGMIAPYGIVLAKYSAWAPGAVFGACCILPILIQLWLPESMDRELPQTLRDLEAWFEVTSGSDKDAVSTPTGETPSASALAV